MIIVTVAEYAKQLELPDIAGGNWKQYDHPGKQCDNFLQSLTYTYCMISHSGFELLTPKKQKFGFIQKYNT